MRRATSERSAPSPAASRRGQTPQDLSQPHSSVETTGFSEARARAHIRFHSRHPADSIKDRPRGNHNPSCLTGRTSFH